MADEAAAPETGKTPAPAPALPIKLLIMVVAAALVDVDGRVLLARRPAGKALAGLWEFPGGKVEAGETPVAALARELAPPVVRGDDEERLARVGPRRPGGGGREGADDPPGRQLQAEPVRPAGEGPAVEEILESLLRGPPRQGRRQEDHDRHRDERPDRDVRRSGRRAPPPPDRACG